MRKLLLFVVMLPMIALAQDCKKCFQKQKKSKKKSELFAEQNLTITKPIPFYNEYKRDLYVQFKEVGGKKYAIIKQHWYSALKSPLVLGNSIKIGIKFNSGETYFLTFDGNENKDFVSTTGTWMITSNQKEIDKKLDNLLKTQKISLIEIMNPINSYNQSKVISQNQGAKSAARIQKYYTCFSNKISEIAKN